MSQEVVAAQDFVAPFDSTTVAEIFQHAFESSSEYHSSSHNGNGKDSPKILTIPSNS
jgi:hypothetical protein